MPMGELSRNSRFKVSTSKTFFTDTTKCLPADINDFTVEYSSHFFSEGDRKHGDKCSVETIAVVVPVNM